MRSLVAFILVLVHCPVGLAHQLADDEEPRVRITASDGLGVRVENRPTLAVDIDKVVVPSVYLWGASDITLSFGGEPRQVRSIFEAPGVGVSMIVFEPPIPPEAVPSLTTALDLHDLGTWLSRGRENLGSRESERVRVLWFRRNLAGVTMDVTRGHEAALGSEFYFSDGRVAGLVAFPFSLQIGYPETMQLCPAFTLRDYVALLDDNDHAERPSFGSPDHGSPVVDELARLLLSEDVDVEALERVTATWTQRDSDWSTRLPQELYFGLMTIASKRRLGALELQMLDHPPELSGGEADRLRFARAVYLVRHGPVANGIAVLEDIIEEGGPVMPVACVVMADILSRTDDDSSRARAVRYLRRAAEEYKSDPRPYDLGARIYATSQDVAAYIDISQMRQQTDYSAAASLEPAEQLLTWGSYEQAVAFARTGVERWPDDADCRVALIRALIGLEDTESARRHFDELRQRSPDRATSLLNSDPSFRVLVGGN